MNELIINFIVVALVLILLVSFIIIIAFLFQRRQSQNKREKDALKAQYDKEILQSQIEVQNATMQQIGKELHDNIGQLLFVAKINLTILLGTQQDPDNKSYITQANDNLEYSLQEIRTLTKSLDGDFVHDFGLQESIDHELQRIQKTKKFETDLIIHGDKYTFGYEREIVLFRIVQEILGNTMKHSEAKRIEIILNYLPHTFRLAVSDDGKGFDYELALHNAQSQSGVGLRNIRKRAKLINFACEVDSQIGEGTIYVLTSAIKEIELKN